MATLNCIQIICLWMQMIDIVYGNQQRFSNATLQLGLLGCNFEKFCSVTIDPPLENGTNTTCCSPCSCLPNCWLIGDCCPDVEEYGYALPFGNVELKCERNYLDVRQHGDHLTAYYMMITQCPTNYTDTKTKQLCEDPFGTNFSIHNFSFSDILPVSSPDQVVYRNVHCAACHRIHDTTRWDMVFTSCRGLARYYTDLNYVIENCRIYAVPPEGLGAERSKCFGSEAVISTCNVDGKLDYVDEDVEKACKFSMFPIVYKYFVRPTVYKNVFCLLCNIPLLTNPLHCIDEASKGLLTPYTSFFTFDMTRTTMTKTPRVYRCSTNEVFDDVMDVCRDLICPLNRKPEYEACVESGLVWYDVVIKFPMSVSITGVNIETVQDIQQIAKIEKMFMSSIGLSPLCYNCVEDSFYSGSDEQGLIVDMSIYLTRKCKYDYIETSMAPIKSKTIHFEVPLNETLSINVTTTMFPIFNRSVNKDLFCFNTCGDAIEFKITKVFDCPYIVLNETEYCTWTGGELCHPNKSSILSVNTIYSKQTMELVYTDGEINVRICLSSYLPRFFKSIGRSLFQPYLNICLICAGIFAVYQH